MPSFSAGIPELDQLPVVSTVPSSAKDVKQRKANILGLNPSLNQDDHSSDDENEEAKLGQTANDTGLQFEHRGQVSTLKTASEIKAWIAERKKRFPTAAKAAIAQHEAGERKAKEEAERRERADAARKRREEFQAQKTARIEAVKSAAAGAQKIAKDSTRTDDKAERLRQQARKAAKQLEKAQKALQRLESTPRQRDTTGGKRTSRIEAAKPNPNATASEHAQPETDAIRSEIVPDTAVHPVDNTEAGLDSDDATLTDESTSSSGSDSSSAIDDSDSDLDSSSSSPETLPATVNNATGEPQADSGLNLSTSQSPTPHQTAQQQSQSQSQSRSQHPSQPETCRNFAKTGKCKFGKRCRRVHERRDNGGRGNGVKPQRQRRKGLWETMVAKEQEQEREKMLQAIVVLGDVGRLG